VLLAVQQGAAPAPAAMLLNIKGSLTSLREELIKIGAKAISNARYVTDGGGRRSKKSVC
jgi:hypothetical protein